jgi:YD repeat-containing protein
LPQRSTTPLHLEDAALGAGIDFALNDVRDTAAVVADGYVVYAHAHVTGATILHRTLLEGDEDFLSFDERPSAPVVSYRVTIGKGVSGLRLVADTLEFVDADGSPRLRMAPPYIVGSDGTRTDARLAVEDCAVDTSPAAPWGREVTAPGASSCTVRVSWQDESVVYPALLDPRWTTTASLSVARQDHTATLLSTGKVLVAGGRSSPTSTTALATAELYDRTTNTWAATASMSTARWSHAAVQLGSTSSSTTSGKVLISGGINGTTSTTAAELYSASAGTWTGATSLNSPCHLHTATLLSNGRVLVAGGMNGTTVINTAAVYDPSSGTGTWTATGNMASARRSHTATLLAVPGNSTLNNKVLVVGGNSGGTTSLTGVELFDGTSWATGTALSSAREGQTATALANGNVLVTGGLSGTTVLATTLLFNAASGSGTWASAGNMTVGRSAHTATLLPAAIVAVGQVLVIGGSNGTASQSSAETWDGTSTWTATTAMATAVQGHTATLLSNSAVLIAGGVNGSTTTATARTYDPSFGLTCSADSQCTTGFCRNGVCCDTACTNACSACNVGGTVGTCTALGNGANCNDGNACTLGETCQSGVCTAPIFTTTCAAPDQCHIAGTCVPATGLCVYPNKNDGTTCNDNNPCSPNDTCQAGICTGGALTNPLCDGSPQVKVDRQAGLIPAYVAPTYFPPKADPNVLSATDPNASTHALNINNAGTVVGYTDIGGGVWPNWLQAASPFIADWSGQHLLANPWPGRSADAVAINDSGETLGFGSDTTGNVASVLYHADRSVLILPVPSYSRFFAMNNTYGATGLPTMIGDAPYGGIQSGTLGLWRFDGDGSDVIGPSAVSLPTNPTWVAGHTGAPTDSALWLDGTFCPVGSGANTLGGPYSAGLTMMAWVKPDATMCPGGTRVILSRGESYQLALVCSADNKSAALTGSIYVGGTPGNFLPAAGSIPFGTWSHVAMTWDRKTVKSYVNGVPVGTDQPLVGSSILSYLSAVSVGCGIYQPGTFYFKGALDEVSAFHNPMAADQIKLFSENITNYPPFAVMDGLLRFKDGFFDVILPSADPRYANGGTIVGLNDSGVIVGSRNLAQGGTSSAVMFDPQIGWKDLNELIAPDSGWNLQYATAINNEGQIVGRGLHNGQNAAFRLDTYGGDIIDLTHLQNTWANPAFFIIPDSINSHGDVSGALYDNGPYWPSQAFLYTDALGLIDLNSLMDPTTAWTLTEAMDVNDGDQVAGWATSPGGQRRGFTMSASASQAMRDANAASLTPQLVGVASNSAGQLQAIFTYQSPLTSNVFVPYGSDNMLSDDLGPLSSPAVSPPQWFNAHGAEQAFVIPMTRSLLRWTLGGKSVVAFATQAQLSVTTSPNGVRSITLPGGSQQLPIESNAPDVLANSVLATTLATSTSTTAAGRTEGTFSVSDNGAATYKIPLWVPDGRAGVQPHLSLSYSSTGKGDDDLGYGWRVDGLSAITRCHDDFTRDGDTKPIQFNGEDKLCLDGMRLVAVADSTGTVGTYLQPGTEYRTEIDKFIKVVQLGSDSVGPIGFTVYMPDGRIRRYGRDQFASCPTGSANNPPAYQPECSSTLDAFRAVVTADPNLFTGPTLTYEATPVRLTWALASEKDRYNNEMTLAYASDPAPGEGLGVDFRPLNITYTQGPTGAANREIDFNYNVDDDPRMEVRESYVGGVRLVHSHLLVQIMAKGPRPISKAALRSYTMSYRNEFGKRARINSIQECDGLNVCKPATTFQWTDPNTDPNTSFQKQAPTGITDIYQDATGAIIAGDVTGDGKDDILFSKLHTTDSFRPWFFYISNGAGFGSETPVNFPQQDGAQAPGYVAQGVRAVDIDMDGRVDILMPVTAGAPTHFEILRSTGSNFTPLEVLNDYEVQGLGIDIIRHNLFVGDFTGNGLPDLMRPYTLDSDHNPVWAYRTNNPGFGGYQLRSWMANDVGTYLPAVGSGSSYTVDVDGDGKAELITSNAQFTAGLPVPLGSRMFVIKGLDQSPPVSVSLRQSNLMDPTSVHYQMIDFNGDGLSDAVEIPNGGGDIRVYINNGRDFMPPIAVTLPTNGKMGQALHDLLIEDSGPVPIDAGIRTIDYDMDGRSDLFLMNDGCRGLNGGAGYTPRSHPQVLLSKGLFVSPSTGGVSVSASEISNAAIGHTSIAYGATLPGCYPSSYSQVLDVNGDGLSDFVQIEGGVVVVYLRQGTKADLLKNVTDGYGHTVDITYKPISDSSVYTAATNCTYPQYCTNRGMWVVSNHNVDAASATPLHYRHTYVGARTDIAGIGYLGMDEHIQTDSDSTATVDTVYDHRNKYGAKIYPLLTEVASRHEKIPISGGRGIYIDKQWANGFDFTVNEGGSRIAATPSVVTYSENELPMLDSTATSCTSKNWSFSTDYDPRYGYLKSKALDIDGEHRQWTYTFYADQPSAWLNGLVDREIQTQTTPTRVDSGTPSETVTRTVHYGRDLSTGAVTSVFVEPDSTSASLHLQKAFDLDAAGMVVGVTQTTLDGQTRRTTTAYDAVSSTYPRQEINALGQETDYVYHSGLGVLVQEKDPNGLLVTRDYDGFGRLRDEHRPDGSFVTLTYRLDSARGLPLVIDKDTGDSLESDGYDFRGLDAMIFKRNEVGGFNQIKIDHDRYGRVHDEWRPYPQSQEGQEASLPHTTFLYDEAHRIASEQKPIGSTTWSRVCNVTTRLVASATGPQEDDSQVDQSGRLLVRTEKVGAGSPGGLHSVITRYIYGPFGLLRDLIDTNGDVTHIEYDVRGRRHSLSDPDSGFSVDGYNAFDELVTQADAGGRSVTLFHDPLGRIQSEDTSEGTNLFLWDTAEHGVGQLGGTIGQDGVNSSFAYDAQGRRATEQWTIGGAPPYQFDFGYTPLGRPSTLTYPQVGTSRYAIQFNYTSFSGELANISGPGNALLWRADTRNSDRNITQETFGDGVVSTRGYEPQRGMLTSIFSRQGTSGPTVENVGYVYDLRGYMSTRTNYVGAGESFTHDELGRLTDWNNGGGWDVSYSYDDMGNMLTRNETVGDELQSS